MRFLCLFLLLGVLVHGARLNQEPDQLLQPALVEAGGDGTVICTQNCDVPSVDCQYSGWSEWGPCWGASDCGGPYFVNRTRYIVVQAVAYGTPCTAQSLFDSRACTAEEEAALTSSANYQSRCAVPCQQGPWTVKTPCDVSQATCPPRASAPANARIEGRVTYSRDTLVEPQYGGAKCGPNEKTEICYFDCKYDCEWGPWQNDGCELPCKPPVDGTTINHQRLTRRIQYFAVNGGVQCTGDSSKLDGECSSMDTLPPCCPGCTEGPWGDWSPCSVTCGYGGSRYRTRQVTTPSEWYTNPTICGNAMPVCGATQETQECCTDPCAEDCRCGDWTLWSDCMTDNAFDMACGEGKRYRSRICLPPQNGGKECPPQEEEMTCVLEGCPVNCEVNEWGEWSVCPNTCGIRLSQRRTRTVRTPPVNGGSPCPDLIDERACPCLPCPEDCQLSPWSAWGPCDTPCGPGKRQRTRDVIVVPRNGGIGCNVTYEEAPCVVNTDGGYFDEDGQWTPANKPCDVNCKVGAWGAWSPCDKTCTSDEDATFPGTRHRSRTVEQPPQYNGLPCPATIEYEWCATQCCPVDMTLSPWGDWSACTATCGGGWQMRQRHVVQYPRCGGRVLTDPLVEYQPCNPQCCQRECVYHPYTSWGPCHAADPTTYSTLYRARDFVGLKNLIDSAPLLSCPGTTGYQYRTRDVRIDNDCAPCTDTFQPRSCSIQCPVDCVMGPWGTWSSCDRECGWGAQRRTRSPSTENSYGGTPCPCSEEVRPCYSGPCCKDCVLTPWNEWEACSATCGGGTQHRRRYVNMSTEFCPELECKKAGLIEERSCNTQDCPTPCEMGPWSGWSDCSSSCGLGFQYHTRDVAHYGDGRCEWDYEERPCKVQDCPIPCAFTEFTEWSQCPFSCLPPSHQPDDRVKQYRAAYRVSGSGVDCPTVRTEERDCEPYPYVCDQMCLVSEWGPWSNCSSQYGWGERRRDRTIIQSPTGSEICPQLYQIDRCYHEPPANNCTWSTWSDWSSCEAPCRTSTNTPSRYRERHLVRAPGVTDYTAATETEDSSVTLDLNACASTGSKVETQACIFLPFCPQDCVMSHWSAWGPCVFPGFRERHRHIVSLPQFGGQACPPCLTERDQCQIRDEAKPMDECEVGKCALEVEQERAAKEAATAAAGFSNP